MLALVERLRIYQALVKTMLDGARAYRYFPQSGFIVDLFTCTRCGDSQYISHWITCAAREIFILAD